MGTGKTWRPVLLTQGIIFPSLPLWKDIIRCGNKEQMLSPIGGSLDMIVYDDGFVLRS